MRSLICIATAALLALPLAGVGLASCGGLADDDAGLLKKHVQFLQKHLDDKDEHNQAQALEALAVYDLPSHMERIRKAVHSSSDLVQMVGLTHLRGRADRDDLAKIKELIVAIGPKSNREDGGNESITESFALEALLASKDANMRGFAVGRIRSILQSPASATTRFWVMVEVAGDHGLKELAPVIREAAAKRTKNKEGWPILALAQLGDAEAVERLKKAVAPGATDINLWWQLSGNRKGQDVAGIDLKQMRELVRGYSFAERAKEENRIGGLLEKDRLLAHLGDLDGLLRLVQGLGEGKELPGGERFHVEVLSILLDAAQVGDQRFLKSLDELFEKTADESRRVDCSAAMVRILARQRASADRRK